MISQKNKKENKAETIHNRATLIDLHNDLLENTARINYNWGEKHSVYHTDIPRLIEGGVKGQIFAVWISSKSGNCFNRAVRLINTFNKQIELNSQKIGQAKNPDDLLRLNKENRIAAILGLEGGYIIEDRLNNLRSLYDYGARYLTITWENSTSWATSAKDKNSKIKGLTEFGKEVIKTMDSLGMIIDVSHTGIRTIEDILKITKNPIIASHSGAYKLRPHYRNLTDDQIRAIAKTDGLIGVSFYPPFLSNIGKATVETVVNHIDYIVKLVGVDYVAIGSDFDGIELTPEGLEDVSKFPNLTKELLKRGYSEPDIKKILGENFLRVFKRVCR